MNTVRREERFVTETSPAPEVVVSESGPRWASSFVSFGDPTAAFCTDDHCEIPAR